MNENNGSGVVGDRRRKDFARVDDVGVKRSCGNGINVDKSVADVEGEKQKVFFLFISNFIFEKVKNIFGPFDFFSVLLVIGQSFFSKFEGGFEFAGGGKANAFDFLQLFD